MERKLTLSQYVSASIKHFSSLLYQDLYTVDNFNMLDDGDIELVYHVNGKRNTSLRKRVSQVVNDKDLFKCFSREDVLDMGVFYGRLMEKAATNATDKISEE